MENIKVSEAKSSYLDLLKREIELNPSVDPADTAYRVIYTNIIGPLFHFSLAESSASLGEVAVSAAIKAYEETDAYYKHNPLAVLDLPLMRAEAEFLQEEDSRTRHDNLFQVRRTREALRGIERGVKDTVFQVDQEAASGDLGSDGQKALVQSIYTNRPSATLQDGLWNWEVRKSDRHNTISQLMRWLGVEEPIRKLQAENPEWKRGVVIGSLPTHATGIWASVDIKPQMRSYDDWAGLYLGLEQSAALAILQQPSLPRLVRALPN